MIGKILYITGVFFVLIVLAAAVPAFSQYAEDSAEEEEMVQSRPNPLDHDATPGARIQLGDPKGKRTDSIKDRSQQQMKKQASPAVDKSGVEMPPHPLGKEHGLQKSGHAEKSLTPAMQGGAGR